MSALCISSDGIGFGITHSMVTMMFESSLQAVNPMLSLPYWDFTIESFLVDTLHDGDYTKMREVSDLWTEEWFGSVDPEDFQVTQVEVGTFVVEIFLTKSGRHIRSIEDEFDRGYSTLRVSRRAIMA